MILSTDRKTAFLEDSDYISGIKNNRFEAKKIKHIDTQDKEDIQACTIIDDEFLVTGSLDESIKVYSLKNLKLIRQIPGCGEPILGLGSFRIKNKTLLVSNSFDETLRVHDIHDKNHYYMTMLLGIGDIIVAFEDMNDYRHLIAFSVNGNVGIYNIRKSNPVFIKGLGGGDDENISCMKIVDREQNIYLVAGFQKLYMVAIGIKESYNEQCKQIFSYGLQVIHSFPTQENIISMSVEFQENFKVFAIYGTESGSLIKLEISQYENQPQEEYLIRGDGEGSELNEILIVQENAQKNQEKQKCSFVFFTRCDKEGVFLYDLQENREFRVIQDEFLCYYHRVQSKIQFFDRNGGIGLAIVNQKQPQVFVYQIQQESENTIKQQ